jgi:hypothetical protein
MHSLLSFINSFFSEKQSGISKIPTKYSPRFKNIGRFGKSRCIMFATYLDIMFIYAHKSMYLDLHLHFGMDGICL